jgi:Kef-type K+ transport system membrane component KefB
VKGETLLLLVLQIAVVLGAARVVGLLFRRIRQPQVMGEMVAGILLGPSLLGWLAPGASAVLFPPGSLDALAPLSQIGVLLFMFLIGVELEPRLLRSHTRTALVTSLASIAAPFALGLGLAPRLYESYAEPGAEPLAFALFFGAAMSVTAFPVLARILVERNLLRSRVGAVTIACAAAGDVAAWMILAGVVAFVRADETATPPWWMLAGAALYAGVMVAGVRPLLGRLDAFSRSRGRVTQDVLGLLLVVVMASAFATEWLGIHALFGAFFAGAMMPKDSGFVRDVSEKLQDLTVVFLLPLFFAVTGLRTQIGLVHGAGMWLDCAAIIGVAVLGKFGGSALAARATGLAWREAGALGVLMNTRGLMELVFLTIGLEIGVISPTIFTMMVLMALVTTFMTSPLLEWIYPSERIRRETLGAPDEGKEFGVLVPVALPSSGPELLRLAAALVPPGHGRLYALHLEPAADQSMMDPGRFSERPTQSQALAALIAAAADRGTAVRPLSFVSRDPGSDIAEVARAKRVDLILMGWHKPVLSQSILSGAVRTVMEEAQADVAVYVPRHFHEWRRVLVPWLGEGHDEAALELARRLAAHGPTEIELLQVVDPEAPPSPAPAPEGGGITLRRVVSDDPIDAVVAETHRGYDLVVLGATESLGLEPRLFGARHERIARECPASLVIVSRRAT